MSGFRVRPGNDTAVVEPVETTTFNERPVLTLVGAGFFFAIGAGRPDVVDMIEG